MAVVRDRPYRQFNFHVNLGDGVTSTPQAGFQEVSGIGMGVSITDARPGHAAFNSRVKTAGLHKATEVTMKRGVMGALALCKWLDDMRNGASDGLRTVTVELMSEDRTQTVQAWRLINARIMKHTAVPFDATGTAVVMEALTLSCERLELA